MILFQTETFKHNKVTTPFEKKLNILSFLFFIGLFITPLLMGHIGISKKLSELFCIIVLITIGIIMGIMTKKNEFYYGYFPAKLTFTDKDISIGDQIFPYTTIDNITFEKIFYKGEGVGKHKHTGIQNVISIYCNGVEIQENFYIKDKTHLDTFNYALIFLLSNEKIKYNRKYLNYIKDEYKHSNILFEQFISKLIKEKKIDCTEGLLMIGYNSDEEAKVLRQKYCSES